MKRLFIESLNLPTIMIEQGRWASRQILVIELFISLISPSVKIKRM